MADPDWLTDLADIILQVWMEDVTAYVTVDQVRAEMAQRGHDMSREEIADSMGVVAAENGWQIEQTNDDLIQVLPVKQPGGADENAAARQR